MFEQGHRCSTEWDFFCFFISMKFPAIFKRLQLLQFYKHIHVYKHDLPLGTKQLSRSCFENTLKPVEKIKPALFSLKLPSVAYAPSYAWLHSVTRALCVKLTQQQNKNITPINAVNTGTLKSRRKCITFQPYQYCNKGMTHMRTARRLILFSVPHCIEWPGF